MKIKLIIISIILSQITAYSQLFPVLGGQRAGISTAQFLKIPVGARASAISDAFIAMSDDATALYWNPAGLIHTKGHQVVFSHTNWVVDVKHQFFGAVYKVSDNFAVGASLIALTTEDMKVTTETMPFGTGEYFSYRDLAFGLSFGYKLTEQFSFGATIKYLDETMAKVKMNGVLIDLGTYYWTGLGTSRFAVAVSNFGSDLTPKGDVTLINGEKVSDYQSFSPPTMFKIGFAVEPYYNENYKITTSIQLNHPNDNSENVGFGLEASWKEMFFLRGGYKLNVDEQSFSFGAGVHTEISFAKFGFDYSFVNFERLGGVHRFSIILGIL